MTTLTLAKALNAGLRRAMTDDDKVVLMGEDIGKLGGVYRVTDGLQNEFGPRRVMDMCITRSGCPFCARRRPCPTTSLAGRNPALAKEWVPKICSGEEIVGIGLTEPHAGSDAGMPRLTADRDGDSYVLDGVKSLSFANDAAAVVVFGLYSHPIQPRPPLKPHGR